MSAKSDEWPLVAVKLNPILLPRIAAVMRRQGIASRPQWLTAAVEAALADQESEK